MVSQPGVAQVWQWLEQVTDPEIPVISVIELGIVREVDMLADGSCTVTITPTYSGCPAMQVIADDITAALQRHGITRVHIKSRLTPAWTTDWMSETGKAKLSTYGIAPPAQQVIDISAIGLASLDPGVAIACPQCGSLHTRLVSQFGSTACKALYRCVDCLEPFDYFKPH